MTDGWSVAAQSRGQCHRWPHYRRQFLWFCPSTVMSLLDEICSKIWALFLVVWPPHLVPGPSASLWAIQYICSEFLSCNQLFKSVPLYSRPRTLAQFYLSHQYYLHFILFVNYTVWFIYNVNVCYLDIYANWKALLIWVMWGDCLTIHQCLLCNTPQLVEK